MRIALVTGSRDWTHSKQLEHVLEQYGATMVIHGACKTGADAIADRWATANEVDCWRIPARWRMHGKSAGSIRNTLLIDAACQLKGLGNRVEVFGFPLAISRGTWDCLRKAHAKGLDCFVWSEAERRCVPWNPTPESEAK